MALFCASDIMGILSVCLPIAGFPYGFRRGFRCFFRFSIRSFSLLPFPAGASAGGNTGVSGCTAVSTLSLIRVLDFHFQVSLHCHFRLSCLSLFRSELLDIVFPGLSCLACSFFSTNDLTEIAQLLQCRSCRYWSDPSSILLLLWCWPSG